MVQTEEHNVSSMFFISAVLTPTRSVPIRHRTTWLGIGHGPFSFFFSFSFSLSNFFYLFFGFIFYFLFFSVYFLILFKLEKIEFENGSNSKNIEI
jgi:hypothetical protein